MNKFELNEIKANALTNVANSIQYYIESAQSDFEGYKQRVIDETAEGETPDFDSYWGKQMKQAQERLNLWNEIAAMLEKKLSK